MQELGENELKGWNFFSLLLGLAFPVREVCVVLPQVTNVLRCHSIHERAPFCTKYSDLPVACIHTTAPTVTPAPLNLPTCALLKKRYLSSS